MDDRTILYSRIAALRSAVERERAARRTAEKATLMANAEAYALRVENRRLCERLSELEADADAEPCCDCGRDCEECRP